MRDKEKREGPLKVPLGFDDAIKRAMSVAPPEGGWGKYEAAIRKAKAKKRRRATQK